MALRGIKPPIWRKVIVPSNISLRLFGDLILELMGWMGEHLNQFRKGDSCFAPFYQRKGEMPPLFGRIRNYNQEDFALGEILCEKGDTMIWEYDFGDSWEHDVRLSSVEEYAEGEARKIVFVGGKRACPPEDCGGIWAMRNFWNCMRVALPTSASRPMTASVWSGTVWTVTSTRNGSALKSAGRLSRHSTVIDRKSVRTLFLLFSGFGRLRIG